MHVAMVTPFPQDPERPQGAMQVIAVPLIRSLTKLGARVTVINWGSKETGSYTEPSLGCTVVPLPLE